MITAQDLKHLSPEAVRAFAASLTPAEAEALHYDWNFWARPNQQPPPGNWLVWLLMAGRGFGKSRTGAETVRKWVNEGAQHIALVGKTPDEVRDVMIQNPLKSGILDVFPPDQRPVYVPSKKAVHFHTGAVAKAYSGEEPNALRGPAHSHFWLDELPKFQYPVETWDNLMLGLRVGDHPQGVVTTTPLPIPIVRRILADPQTVVTRGSTYENLANLAPTFRDQVLRMYEGTRLGRQELHGELLEDTPGALWRYEMFRRVATAPDLPQVVVAIDPAVTNTAQSDETGIIVAGRDAEERGYVLADLSGRFSPDGWANRALDAYESFQADRVVCETNNGGDMVKHTIQTAARARDLYVRVQKVTASRGKFARAEPVAMLYEQGRVYHVGPPDLFTKLEDQLCTWSPQLNVASPDRLDACVWACHVLFVLRPPVGLPLTVTSTAPAPVEAPPQVILPRRDWFPRDLMG